MSNHRVHWCSGCNVPITDETCENCGEQSSNSLPDLRPIFSEEIDFLNSELNCKLDPSKVYFKHNNNVFQSGKELFSFHVSENGLTAKKSRIQPDNIGEQCWAKLLSANDKHLNLIETEAIDFIKKTVASHIGKSIVVSFSGGKDSAVTAHLVKRALGKVSLVFSNTTIEFPETVQFARNFSNEMDMNMVELSPTNEFTSICRDLGPPSRMMRWCCFTQKSAPINAFYADSDKQFLTFAGIRKAESVSRANLGRAHKNTKIIKQFSAYPIFNWSDLEVWLYMLSRGIPINPLYFKGYNRIGCWACPNNGKFDEYLIRKTHPTLSKGWINYLVDYANANGKTPDWVFLGKWKQRTTKYEKFEICTCQNVCTKGSKFLFMLKDRPFTEEIVEFFKIFGNRTVEVAGGQKMVRIEGPKMVIAAIIGSNSLRVMFTDMSCFSRSIFEVRKQLEKAVNCVNCGACVGSCRIGAIQCNGRLKINESCVHCLECVTSKHLKQSCIALHYKNKRSTVERSSLSLIPQPQKVTYPSISM